MASSKFEKIVLTEEEHKRLERIKNQLKTPQKPVRRTAIVLDLLQTTGLSRRDAGRTAPRRPYGAGGSVVDSILSVKGMKFQSIKLNF